MKDFGGKVAVVTGAASGIGRALCARFAGLGMKVVMADVEARALGEAGRQLEGEGAEVLTVQTDVSRAEAVHALAEKTVDAFGGVHVLCNNAGVFAGGLCWEAPLSDYEWVLGVNVWGVIHGIRSFVPIMLDQDCEGHILNSASMASVTASPFAGSYSMSKAAIFSLSETLYLEMQAKGGKIGVSVLCPELVKTGIGDAERNRPAHLGRKGDEGASPERDLTEAAIKAATATGLDPTVLADRGIAAIRENRLYVLASDEDPWRQACNARLEDLRLARNPSGAVPGGE
jgi:NAD(P)-dependent dehydrogenase (short-subunit alcohol dehydrogenase family)